MKVFDEAIRIMQKELSEDGTIFECIIGGWLLMVTVIIELIGVGVLFVTTPLWVLPYLIYKAKESRHE